jgi:hypothetical protein
MSRFRYAADPLCLTCGFLYLINGLWLRAALGGPFLTGHFNDLLLILCALPPLLWLHRRLGWRGHDRAPELGEVLLHVAVWSVVCEGFGPWVMPYATADLRDVAAYALGGIAAWCGWRLGAGAPIHACHSARSFASARARWLMRLFTSSPSSAKDCSYPAGMNSGS